MNRFQVGSKVKITSNEVSGHSFPIGVSTEVLDVNSDEKDNIILTIRGAFWVHDVYPCEVELYEN